jgi:hypothetical protein
MLAVVLQAINSTPAHPLLSLQVLHLPSSSEQLLQEIAVVGQHLTHLEINRGGTPLFTTARCCYTS